MVWRRSKSSSVRIHRGGGLLRSRPVRRVSSTARLRLGDRPCRPSPGRAVYRFSKSISLPSFCCVLLTAVVSAFLFPPFSLRLPPLCPPSDHPSGRFKKSAGRRSKERRFCSVHSCFLLFLQTGWPLKNGRLSCICCRQTGLSEKRGGKTKFSKKPGKIPLFGNMGFSIT